MRIECWAQRVEKESREPGLIVAGDAMSKPIATGDELAVLTSRLGGC